MAIERRLSCHLDEAQAKSVLDLLWHDGIYLQDLLRQDIALKLYEQDRKDLIDDLGKAVTITIKIQKYEPFETLEAAVEQGLESLANE